jgi:hypothetical protein
MASIWSGSEADDAFAAGRTRSGVIFVFIPGADEPNTGLFGRVSGSVLEQARMITSVMMMNQVYRVLFILISLRLLKAFIDSCAIGKVSMAYLPSLSLWIIGEQQPK